MIRHRWIYARWPLNMRTLAIRLSKFEYKSNAQTGFILDRARSNVVEGRFVEKISFSERVINPLGGEQLLDRVEYRISEFRAYDDDHRLEIINPPRSTAMFLNALSEACDDALALQTLEIDPLHWGLLIGDRVGEQCRFLSLQLSKISLSETASAQIVLNGTPDVRPYLDEFTQMRRFVVEKAKIEIGGRERHTFILGRQATASFTQDASINLLHIIRSTLRNVSS